MFFWLFVLLPQFSGKFENNYTEFHNIINGPNTLSNANRRFFDEFVLSLTMNHSTRIQKKGVWNIFWSFKKLLIHVVGIFLGTCVKNRVKNTEMIIFFCKIFELIFGAVTKFFYQNFN